MKKTKRLLSALTALTITASAFAGMVIPASAADDGTVAKSYDYETDGGKLTWTTGTSGRFTPAERTVDDNTFLTVAQGERSNNGATITSADIGYSGTRYAVEFDMKIATSGEKNASFQVNTTDGYLFSLTSNGNDSWTINGDKAITLTNTAYVEGTTDDAFDSRPWYHFTIAYGDGATYVTVDDYDETTDDPILAQSLTLSGTSDGGVSTMQFVSGKTLADFAIDNIVVRNLKANEIPDTKFYNVIINTTRYATMTQKDGTIRYADVNGVIKIPNQTTGTEIEYTLSKTGYTSEEGSVTVEEEDITQSKPLTLNQDGGSEAAIYFESDFGNEDGAFKVAAGTRGGSANLGTVTLPSMATVSLDYTVDKAEEAQITFALKNSSGKVLVGLQGNSEGLIAFTGWAGSAAMNNNTTDINTSTVTAYTNSQKIADTYYGSTMNIEFVFDRTNSVVSVKYGTVTASLPLTEDASDIATLIAGKYRNTATLTVDNVKVTEPNPNYIQVSGDTEFAKITGKTVTRQFIASPAVPVANEEFTWKAVDKTTSEAVTGVTIDDNGVLSVTDAVAADTVVTVSATSKTTETKTGSTDVTIKDVATLTPTIEGAKAIELGGTATYTVTRIVDQYGDDVTEYFTPVWSIDGVPSTDTNVTFDVTGKSGTATAISASYDGNDVLESVSTEDVTIAEGDTSLTVSAPAGSKVMLWDTLSGMKPISDEVKTAPAVNIPTGTVAAVGSKTGKVTTYDTAGDVTLKVTLGTQTETYDVTVGTYSIVEDYDASDLTVDVSSIKADTAITGYQVTIADASGNKLAQNTVAVADAADDQVTFSAPSTGTPAKVEVAPVYETTIGKEIKVPAASYNVTITANSGSRTDVYVNDQMVFNNVNQGGDNYTVARTIPDSADYTVNDIVIAEGYANFNLQDDKSGGTTITGVKFVKSPSIVTRAKRVYVIGDSLVANYYGTAPAGSEGLVRTGWGQVLQDYMAEGVEVTNLGNSGAWATGMLSDAFTNVIYSAQPGDIVVWESGYNDDSHGGATPMKAAITEAVNKCKELGVEMYIVTPNASLHDYKENVKLSADVRTVATETNTPLIDLAKLSYAFLSGKYGTTLDETATATLKTYYCNSGDTLHSTYNAANCYASIVAQGLYDAGKTDLVNTTHTYTFNDGTNDITVGVTAAN